MERGLEGLEAVSRAFVYLPYDLRRLVIRYSRRLIVKELLNLGGLRRRGRLTTRRFRWDSDDIDVDATLESWLSGALRDPGEIRVVTRSRGERAYVLMVDRSFSMSGFKIFAASVAAAALALATPNQLDYGVLAFNTTVTWVKRVGEYVDREEVVSRILELEAEGYTDIYTALMEARREILGRGYKKCIGVLMTDGEWTAGPNPLRAARLYDELHVLILPSRWTNFAATLARVGGGRYSMVTSLREIPRAVGSLVGVGD